jgi:hypothetical protein
MKKEHNPEHEGSLNFLWQQLMDEEKEKRHFEILGELNEQSLALTVLVKKLKWAITICSLGVISLIILFIKEIFFK